MGKKKTTSNLKIKFPLTTQPIQSHKQEKRKVTSESTLRIDCPIRRLVIVKNGQKEDN